MTNYIHPRTIGQREDDLSSDAGASPLPPALPAIQTADSFVVVSRWLHATRPNTRYAYEAFGTLAHAVGYHRRLEAGTVRDFVAHGIFAAREGLPVGGALAMAAIDAVTPEATPRPGLREYEPNSPENMMLRDMAAE